MVQQHKTRGNKPFRPTCTAAKEFQTVQRRGPCRTVGPGFGSEIARTLGAERDRFAQFSACGRNISIYLRVSESSDNSPKMQCLGQLQAATGYFGSVIVEYLSECTGKKMHQLATTGDMIETCTCSFSKNQEGLPLPPILKQSLGLDQLDALERQ